MSYAEKLKDQRWQKLRLQLLEAAGWQCQSESCENRNERPTLHIHHRLYLRNTDPWDYEPWAYAVLCEKCHEFEQGLLENAHAALAKYPDLLGACVDVNRMDPDLAARIARIIASLLVIDNKELVSLLFENLKHVEGVATCAFREGISKG